VTKSSISIQCVSDKHIDSVFLNRRFHKEILEKFNFKAEISAIFNSFLCRRRIIAARRQIKRIRKVSDKEIFDATMRMPPLKTLIAKI
jgi:hypothetical protein